MRKLPERRISLRGNGSWFISMISAVGPDLTQPKREKKMRTKALLAGAGPSFVGPWVKLGGGGRG